MKRVILINVWMKFVPRLIQYGDRGPMDGQVTRTIEPDLETALDQVDAGDPVSRLKIEYPLIPNGFDPKLLFNLTVIRLETDFLWNQETEGEGTVGRTACFAETFGLICYLANYLSEFFIPQSAVSTFEIVEHCC